MCYYKTVVLTLDGRWMLCRARLVKINDKSRKIVDIQMCWITVAGFIDQNKVWLAKRKKWLKNSLRHKNNLKLN